MKKLSVLLGTSLIALGLLCTSNTNAMTYTVDGNTQVAIPKNTTNGVSVNWGSGAILLSTCSELNNELGEFYQCSNNYNSSHEVVLNNSNNDNVVVNIFLRSSNISNISDFDGFHGLNTIYLENNNFQEVNRYTFNGLSDTTVYLDNNQIESFNENINNIRYLYLRNNRLKDIPETIRNYNGTRKIILSDTVSYGSNGGKVIDLSNNPINSIRIISSSSSATTNYSAQWFGYTYNDSILDDGKITYNYKIYPKNNELDVRISNSFQENNGTNVSKSISLPSLEPGIYTFKVCIGDTEDICDKEDFNVSYTANIEFTNKPNSSLSSINNISFSRRKTGTYPDEFIEGYKYTLKKGSLTLHNSDTIVSSTSYTPDISLFSNDPNGDYSFAVTLWDTNGNQIGNERKATFNITIDDNIIISSPSGQYTENGVYTKNIDFYWTTASSLFSYYDYYITKNSECTPSNTITSGNNITNETVSFSYPFQPGTYLLCITLHNSNGTQNTNSSSFSINIPSTLTIESPTTGLQTSNNINFRWGGFSPFFDHYEYTLNRTDGGTTLIKSGTGNASFTGFQINGLHHGEYEFNVAIKSSSETLKEVTRTFQLLDDVALTNSITSNNSEISEGGTISSKTATFIWSGKSEDFAGYSYSIIGTTFSGGTYNYTGTELGKNQGSITLSNLQTGKYKFTIAMIDSDGNTITSNEKNFNVVIPATLTITSPSEGATITSSSTTFSWTGYSDVIEKYGYALTYGDQPVDTNNFTNNTKITSPTLKNGNYTLTVWIISGVNVAQDTVHFTVAIPVKTSGGSSSKTHYNNNLKLSLGNDSPSANEWIKLVVKIDDKYTGKVSFPKLQYYSPDTEKWIDIPVTSKNYISDYSDDAKLGYIKFSSSDDGRKDLEQFIKFSKNGYYRIYAEDKDGYDDYIEFQVSNKKVSTNNATTTTNTQNNTTVSNTPSNIDSVINQFMPEVLEQKDTSEEVYIARSCKKYTIVYSDSLNIYTSPNLNISEFFMNKAYLKRYLDSKNKYQSGCPTNIGWISTSYIDRTQDNTRYTAPNGKVYFIIGQEGNYYSNELNRELRTPTSFKTIQELKYYIRDRNPLINMATLGPVN